MLWMSQEDHQRRRHSLNQARRIIIENSTLEATKLIWLWHRPFLSHDTMPRKTMSFDRIKRHRRWYDTSGISHEGLTKHLVHWPQRDFLHVGEKRHSNLFLNSFDQRIFQILKFPFIRTHLNPLNLFALIIFAFISYNNYCF